MLVIMYKLFIKYINKLVAGGNERKITQQSYIALSLVTVVLAGIIGLINYEVGHAVLVIAAIFFAVFLFNAVVWSLLKTIIDTYFSKEVAKPKKKSRK